MSAKDLERFLEGRLETPQGYTLAQVLQLTDEELEMCHDFIQWAFPLPEASSVHPEVPTATPEELSAFSTLAKEGTAVLFSRFLAFLGLKLVPAHMAPGYFSWWPLSWRKKKWVEAEVVPAENFEARRQDWLDCPTHNDLRITRILRSLMLQGLSGDASLFYDFLRNNRPPRHAFDFWTKAMDTEAIF